MKLTGNIILWFLCDYVMRTTSTQQTKLQVLKSLIFNNAKATITLNSTDLKQLMNLSGSSSANSTYSGRRIGFSASLKRQSFTYGSRQTVIFDNILTNDGNGYDDRTGVFTCPVEGSYMFVVDVLCKQAVWLSLKLNRKTVAMLHRDNKYSKVPLVQISRTVLLKLNKGDHVKVVSEGVNAFVNGHDYSGFTGAFVY